MKHALEYRLLLDPPGAGAWNMAVDAVLLESAVAGQATLRWYRWATPTISVGHFQTVGGALSVPPRFAHLPAVRRLSGGGAILHHEELTYACAAPPGDPLAREPGQLYDAVHSALIDVMRRQSVDCRMRGDAAFADHSFLCFARGDARDIVIGPHKIVGSAQRRRRGAVLQHGSLLGRASPHAVEFPGVADLCPDWEWPPPTSLISELTDAIALHCGWRLVPGHLTEAERDRAHELAETGAAIPIDHSATDPAASEAMS